MDILSDIVTLLNKMSLDCIYYYKHIMVFWAIYGICSHMKWDLRTPFVIGCLVYAWMEYTNKHYVFLYLTFEGEAIYFALPYLMLFLVVFVVLIMSSKSKLLAILIFLIFLFFWLPGLNNNKNENIQLIMFLIPIFLLYGSVYVAIKPWTQNPWISSKIVATVLILILLLIHGYDVSSWGEEPVKGRGTNWRQIVS